MSSFDQLKAWGNDCFQKKDYETAVKYYEQAIAANPTNPVGYSNCAMALIKLGFLERASMACEKGLSLVNSENDPHGKIAQKLKWRRKVAKDGPEGDLVDVPIYEVDELPVEFQKL